MGTLIATLLLAEVHTTWVNAIFSWAVSKWLTQATRHTGLLCPAYSQRATSSLLPGESYSLPFLRRMGATR